MACWVQVWGLEATWGHHVSKLGVLEVSWPQVGWSWGHLASNLEQLVVVVVVLVLVLVLVVVVLVVLVVLFVVALVLVVVVAAVVVVHAGLATCNPAEGPGPTLGAMVPLWGPWLPLGTWGPL